MRPLYFAAALLTAAASAGAEPTLVGYARLDAHTFRPGPTSGQFIGPANNVTPPFFDRQPVQGISSLVATDTPGTYLALSDNGYGTKANSADYVLCVYRVTPDFDAGTVAWELAFELSDPDRKAGFPVVADGEFYPNTDVPVPAEIKEKRLLTGADFDVESMVRLPDGTFWIGDEFGPFLLHFDAAGRLMEPPVGLPGEGMHSPDHPTKDPATAKIGRSGGLEGLALFEVSRGWAKPKRQMFYLGLEKRLEHERHSRVVLVEADPGEEIPLRPGLTAFQSWSGLTMPYELHPEAAAIGEMTSVPAPDGEPQRILIIERDSEQANDAIHKHLAVAYFEVGRPESWRRLPFADLLDLADPNDLDLDGNERFRFPYLTIESVLPIDERTVLVCNDNNYPFTDGRPEREGPDATEFILIRFDKPLAELGED